VLALDAPDRNSCVSARLIRTRRRNVVLLERTGYRATRYPNMAGWPALHSGIGFFGQSRCNLRIVLITRPYERGEHRQAHRPAAAGRFPVAEAREHTAEWGLHRRLNALSCAVFRSHSPSSPVHRHRLRDAGELSSELLLDLSRQPAPYGALSGRGPRTSVFGVSSQARRSGREPCVQSVELFRHAHQGIVIHDSQACGEGQAMQQPPVIRKALERVRQCQGVPSRH
jgi:hypothetical protein